MWRAFFLAVGIYACMVGAECLAIEKAVLKPKPGVQATDPAPAAREIHPEEWAPWSLLAGGAVVILYSFTIPKRVRD
jgi:hypothetical protein